MSLYAFIELPSSLACWVTAPDALFPVRTEIAAELQQSESPDAALLLLELERYLDENPDKQARYAEAGGQLAFRTGFELFSNGLKEESLHFYALSLRLRPGDVTTRINYAIALHALEYRSEALAQYQLLMSMTSPEEYLRLWVLAGEIHFLRGEYAEVVRLLQPLAESQFPQDAEFWDLLGEASSLAFNEAGGVREAPLPDAIQGDFVFYELEAGLRDLLKLPPEPFPVRREIVPQIFAQQGPVNLLAMLREVQVFLQFNPDFAAIYAPLLAALAYLAGMAAAVEGEHEQALEIYTQGLAVEPESIALRSHLALSLHCLGRKMGAMAELERVLAGAAEGTVLPLAWMLLARLCAEQGKHARAAELLEQVAVVVPEEKGVQEFLAAMRQKATAVG